MTDQRLTGKVAIVTGAASGIGRAVAGRFVAEGARVVAVDLNEAGLRETVAGLGEAAGSVRTLVADLSGQAACAQAVAAAGGEFGGLNVLANMHGLSDFTDTNILAVSEAVFQRTWEVNVKALFLLIKAAIPELERAGSGSIVNMSSGASLSGSGGTAYTASKGGVNALTRAVAYQFAAKNIRCNCIAPGPIDTPMMHRSFEKLGMTNLPIAPGRIPRIGQAAEVAALVAFLASDESGFITAATYTIDGGSSGH